MGLIKTLAVVGGGAYALSELSKQQTANRSANVTVKSQIDPLAVKEAIAKDPTLLQLVRGEKGEKGDTGATGATGANGVSPSVGNHTFGTGEITLGKNSDNNSLLKLAGQAKNYWIYNYNSELRIYTINPDNTGFVPLIQILSDGTVAKIGGGSFSALSDERVKDNIVNFGDGLDKVLAIETKSFNYKKVAGTQTEFYPDSLIQKKQYGVIAQQLKEVCPEMVTQDEQGFYSVDLSNLPLMLVNAVKELNAKLETVTANYEALLQRIEALETPPATA